ncbi:MAG TPA: tetratricopeptide repeat protein [Gemmatimonadales bacterium]
MRRFPAALVPLLALVAARLAAQLPEAEDAFARGDYRTARQLYDSVLKLDSLSPRALYRLAVLDSWDGKLDRSLARFATLRRVEPTDPDIMVMHAKVLSWAGRTGWSAALYDSVLAAAPDRVDALAGRARAVAWEGDLVRAEGLWREALERHPDEPEILFGLAQTLYWEGEPALAEGYAVRARQLAPDDRAARDLFDQLRAERQPVLSLSTDVSNDVDHNGYVTLSGELSGSLRPDLRGTLRAIGRRNEDTTETNRSGGLDGWVVKALHNGASLRGGMGVRVLNPASGSSRGFVTAQLGATYRPARFASITADYTHYPFDETATLVDSGFVWDELEVNTELSPHPTLVLGASADGAWLSDGNRRLSGSASAMLAAARGVHVGGYLRLMGYRTTPSPGRGYFSPDRFVLGEARATYDWRRRGWRLRASAGLGAQQVGTGAATQAEWHGDFTLARTWRALDELALVGTYFNSAFAQTASATTQPYRYWSVGLRYRRGL